MFEYAMSEYMKIEKQCIYLAVLSWTSPDIELDRKVDALY